MTVASQTAAGAASHHEQDWHAIDWRAANDVVRRLQARIVQAERQGKRGKVKALQRLLTHSHSGKALAVRRVTENHGKNTPGVDGVLWRTPGDKARAVQALRWRGYHPQPARRVYIPKPNGKKRPLGIQTMMDRAMQALYLLAVDPVIETRADPNSYGFRKGRSTADALAQCHSVLSNWRGPSWILEGDIKSCFDQISHDWLLANIPGDRTVLRQWLKAGYMEQTVWTPAEAGTAQGGVASPALANAALDGLERTLRERYPKGSAESKRVQANLVRYADDFVITGRSEEILVHEIQPLVEPFLHERGLELSQEKTRITHITDGFDFLGCTIRQYHDGKVLVTPSAKNVATFLAGLQEIIHRNAQATTGHLIMQLNPRIRGWANYHRHGASKQTFAHVDHAIFWMLWRWARRRHPNKSRTWVKDHYFHDEGARHWVFTGTVEGADGKSLRVELLQASSIKITRHVKVKRDAHPYDPAWAPYFAARDRDRMSSALAGQPWLWHLWTEQLGRCPVCQQPITPDTSWNSHHIVRRAEGGSNANTNRVLLHPNCHRQLHHQGRSVLKPCPSRGIGDA